MLTASTEGFSIKTHLKLLRSVCQLSRLSPVGVDANYNRNLQLFRENLFQVTQEGAVCF